MNKNFIKKISVTGLVVFSLGMAAVTPTPTNLGEATVAQAATRSEVDVADLASFTNALQNVNVTKINVTASITFEKNITRIPNRDLEINGNADQGVIINSSNRSIYGRQNRKGRNTLTISNANIVGNQSNGRFFTGGSGNGPSSHGWDVLAKDVTYTGARFVHLSEGKLTFDGTNNITTRAENAWVHDLEFLPNSIYNGIAANKDHGQYSAFYFNGALINGKANGAVKIGEDAEVNVEIGPQSDKNYYYPVFYDKVAQVDIEENASLDVDAAGVAFQFIPRADYQSEDGKNAVLNLGKNSKMYLNGRGGGNYSTMKLQYYHTQVNVNEGAELVVTGSSSRGTIESRHKGSTFNLNAPGNFEVANKMTGQKLFYSNQTTINAENLAEIKYWDQTGGDYQTAPTGVFDKNAKFLTTFGKHKNSQTLSVEATDQNTQENFKMENYGKISLKGEGVNLPPEPSHVDYTVVINSRGELEVTYAKASELKIIINGNTYPVNIPVPYSESMSVFTLDINGDRSDKVEVEGYHSGVLTGSGKNF